MTTILIVEDEHAIRENILELLEVEGYSVVEAENGRLGFEIAQRYHPDLIVSDMMMPEMDGLGLLRAVRSDTTTATIPFIFLTAKADRLDVREGMEVGADDYLTKPFTQEELLKAVRSRLERSVRVHEQTVRKVEEVKLGVAATLPHELRTPLHGIMGAAQILELDHDSMTSEERTEMIGIIRKSGERLEHLILNFLLYTKLDILTPAQKRSLAPVNNAEQLVSEMVDLKIPASRRSDVTFTISPLSIALPEVYCKKMVEELIDNAVKFSPAGSPITIELLPEQSSALLRVTDRGRGMTAEEVGKIGGFTQFNRQQYEQQGMGLGLGLIQKIAAIFDCTLTISSEPGTGTTVTVLIPIAPRKETTNA